MYLLGIAFLLFMLKLSDGKGFCCFLFLLFRSLPIREKLFHLHCPCKKLVEKSNKENLKVIKNTLPNKSRILKSLQKQS